MSFLRKLITMIHDYDNDNNILSDENRIFSDENRIRLTEVTK